MTAGVWDLLEGAGEEAVFSNVMGSPVAGSFIIRLAFFFFCGIWNWLEGFGAGLFAAGRLATVALLTADMVLPVCGLPMLELGRSV